MNKVLFLIITSLIINLQAIHSTENKLRIVSKKVTFGYVKSNKRQPNVIIIHSTYNVQGGDPYDVDLVIKQFHLYRVSAHYLIDRNGVIYNLVDEKNISYHAGKGVLPDGRRGINSCSIGIELINSMTDNPTEIQIQALTELVMQIKKKDSIKYILRHSDIAPNRKTDPWNFNWDSFIKSIQ